MAVVIPTRGRETRLAFALEALVGQTLEADRFEVHVVRAPDALEGGLTSAPPGLDVEFHVAPTAGTAVQRNVGWQASRAPLVAFSDDDCRASPRWLESMLDANQGPRSFLQGRTEPDPDENHLNHGLARTIRNVKPSGWYETCNIAYPRALLEQLGGFDEAIEFLGEDADLGARACATGASLHFVEAALVWHAVHWRSLPTAIRDAQRRGSRPAIIARHPELRRALWLGVFTDPDHIRLLLAIAGLAFVRRKPYLSALAAGPYVKKHFDPTRLTPWGLLRFPMQLSARAVVDSAEVASFAASSVRHRTLVL